MEISDSVRLALLNIQKESITDVDAFSRPFEIDFLKEKDIFERIESAIKNRINNALEIIRSGDKPYVGLSKLLVSPIRSLLVPKKPYLILDSARILNHWTKQHISALH